MFRLLRLGDQLVDGLAGKDLCRQNDAPSAGIDASGLNQKHERRASAISERGQPTAFLGRPPSLPLARAARFLAVLACWPPIGPSLDAIHFLEPSTSSSRAGR